MKESAKNWEWKKLGEIATFINGRAFKPSEWRTSGYPIIRIQNLTSEDSKFNHYNSELEEKYFVIDGDLLVSWSATLGVFIWDGEKAVLNQHIFKAVVNHKIIDKMYLFYVIQTKIAEMKLRVHGSTMTHITKKDFGRIEIPVPPLPIQRKIVSILERAEKLKTLRREANEETNTIIQALFYEMFGDPVRNERKYPIKKLGDLCKIQSGGTPSRKIKEYWENGNIPWVGSTVCKDGYVGSAEEYITEEGLRNSATRWFEANTVLIALVGATIGKTGLLTFRATTNQNIAGIYPINLGELNSRYLFYATQQLYPQFMALSNDSFKMANLSFIKTLEILIPPIPLQNQFASLVEKIESIKEHQTQSTEEINTLFDALMQKAFNGLLVR